MKKFIVLLVMSMALFSCSLDDDTVNFHYEYLGTEYAEFPDEEMQVNSTYTIDVFYYLPSTCYTFLGVSSEQNNDPAYNQAEGTEYFIALNAQVNDNLTCEPLEEAEPESASITFTPLTAGTYRFRFLSGIDDATGNYTYLDYEVEVVE